MGNAAPFLLSIRCSLFASSKRPRSRTPNATSQTYRQHGGKTVPGKSKKTLQSPTLVCESQPGTRGIVGTNVQWVKSKWSKVDLEGKSVEFDFSFSPHHWVKGSGTFRVMANQRGELAIAIEGIPMNTLDKRFYLNQALTDAIHRCAPTALFDFRLRRVANPSPAKRGI